MEEVKEMKKSTPKDVEDFIKEIKETSVWGGMLPFWCYEDDPPDEVYYALTEFMNKWSTKAFLEIFIVGIVLGMIIMMAIW
jgi:hypothetical protein